MVANQRPGHHRCGEKARPSPPHVAFIIETSMAYGREILHGMVSYARERPLDRLLRAPDRSWTPRRLGWETGTVTESSRPSSASSPSCS